ncbi:hypothetical protein ULMS_26620 [Patiriisocius marinistellae]|uniref:Secretion system C-terminal sorting domain-containing protein n=1 Tax=Patiriisocius marinistellae TaxID=2494560 RepID=A0A5J4G0T4_9FLAO|nr:T9SS type A sorting domain-containing protein [Patiriisocius marinistellae]GEQ87154.1 hypothetical protein ULMS_26620 [Patiriisocius marinistellae]
MYLNVTEKQETLFSLYPNPANDTVIITTKTSMTEQLEINIYSMQGTQLQSQSGFVDESINIDVSTFATGVYFVSIKNDNGSVETHKMIIE